MPTCAAVVEAFFLVLIASVEMPALCVDKNFQQQQWRIRSPSANVAGVRQQHQSASASIPDRDLSLFRAKLLAVEHCADQQYCCPRCCILGITRFGRSTRRTKDDGMDTGEAAASASHRMLSAIRRCTLWMPNGIPCIHIQYVCTASWVSDYIVLILMQPRRKKASGNYIIHCVFCYSGCLFRSTSCLLKSH